VYSTCSIAPEENDGVVQRVLKNSAGGKCLGLSLQLLDPLEGLRESGVEELVVGVERTEFGALMLPGTHFTRLTGTKVQRLTQKAPARCVAVRTHVLGCDFQTRGLKASGTKALSLRHCRKEELGCFLWGGGTKNQHRLAGGVSGGLDAVFALVETT